jgi:hypothetical protein
MNENSTPATGSEEAKSCCSSSCSCANLQHQLNSAVVLLLVVSATLTLFFWRQVIVARKDVNAMKLAVAEYQKTSVPTLQDFTRRLQEYGKTHPDVMPILNKYGVNQISNPPAPAAPRK